MKFFLKTSKYPKNFKCYLPITTIQKILICDCKNKCKYEPPPATLFKNFCFYNFEKLKIEHNLKNY